MKYTYNNETIFISVTQTEDH